jgi:hypothetical protein
VAKGWTSRYALVAERATIPAALSPADIATSTTGGTARESPDEADGAWPAAAPPTSVTRLTSGERGATARHRF